MDGLVSFRPMKFPIMADSIPYTLGFDLFKNI